MIHNPARFAAPRRIAVTLMIAAAGGGAAWAVGFPAPWLVGPVIVTSAAAIAGVAKPLPVRLRDAVFVLLGTSIGSAVTPETIRGVMLWPGSMAALGAAVGAMCLASYLILRRYYGWDPVTAFYASPPGALSATLALASATSADMSKVAVVQVFRVFVLVAVAPLAISATGAGAPHPAPAAPVAGPFWVAGLIAAGAAGAWVAHRFRTPGGLMIGAFAVSAALHATGIATVRLPDWVTLPCFVALGAIVGTRFAGLTPKTILGLLGASVTTFAVTAAIAVASALTVGWLLGMPVAQVFVAFAPGGLEAMMLTAFILGLDPAYVGAHHVARFVALSLAVPIAARWLAPAAIAPDISPPTDEDV